MRALIDGDILLYRVGYTTENEPEEIAKFRMDELIHRILEAVDADSYILYLSAGRNDTFRAKLNPEYKANRTQPKPLHYQYLKDYLISDWNAVVAFDEEADDLLGILQTQYNQNGEERETIICSIDKDLLQIPGHHYDFVKEQFNFVTPEQGLEFFYKQLLIGDTADNIKGVAGIGKVKAGRIIDGQGSDGELRLFTLVQDEYRDWLQREWAAEYEEWGDFQEKQMNNMIRMNGIMLKIRTREGEIWKLPEGLDLNPEITPIF